MANSTKFLMAEQVLLRLAGGYRDVAQSVQMEDVVKAIEELILMGAAQTEEDKEFVKDAEYDMNAIFVKFLKLTPIRCAL